MSVVTNVAPAWKYAVAGSILVSMMSVAITWQLTRQIDRPTTFLTTTTTFPTSPESSFWKYLAMGSSAMVIIQWVIMYSCRKSCQLDLTPPDTTQMCAYDDTITLYVCVDNTSLDVYMYVDYTSLDASAHVYYKICC